jgi:HlyD family secretion protein
VSELLRPKVAVPLAVLVLFVSGGWVLRNQLAAERQGEWVRATRGDLITGVDVTGTLASSEAGSFGPPQLDDVWDFKISMMAPEGTEVKQGMPILAFDTSELRKRLDEKTAESESARSEIEKREADLRIRREDEKLKLSEAEATLRKTELKLQAPSDLTGIKERRAVELEHAFAQRQTSQIATRIADLERAANAEITLLRSRQQRAAAIVAESREAIERMTVIAPRPGTVVYAQNWRGDKKKVGDTCWRAERVMEIPDLTRMLGKGDVDEVDAGKIVAGQRVSLRLDAHPDEELTGTIRTVARTVVQQGSENPLKVLHTEIQLDRTDPAAMRPGMRFHGTVELNRVGNALTIPPAAVLITPRGPSAYRRGPLGVDLVALELGRHNERSVEVLAGLSSGDRVMIPKRDAKEKGKS